MISCKKNIWNISLVQRVARSNSTISNYIYIITYNIVMVVWSFLVRSGHISIINLVWIMVALIILQWQLKKVFIRQGLDKIMANNLATSAVSYYVWVSLILGIAIWKISSYIAIVVAGPSIFYFIMTWENSWKPLFLIIWGLWMVTLINNLFLCKSNNLIKVIRYIQYISILVIMFFYEIKLYL